MRILLSFLLIFLLLISCNQNRLKNDEKKLSEQIRTEEQEKLETGNNLGENIDQDSAFLGIRFHEDRSVDPKNPPQIIDIAGSLDNIEDIALSQVASKIKYIRMEAVPDSTLPRNLEYKYYLMDSYIVATNLYGIHLYSKEGKYIRTIIKNDLTGITYDEQRNFIFIRDDHTEIGAGTSVWAQGDNLFYEYTNSITGDNYIMQYDCSQNQTLTNPGFDPENPQKLTGLGNIFIKLSSRNATKQKGQGMWGTDPGSFYGQMNIYSFDNGTYIKKLRGDDMMAAFNSRGDTLTTFTKLERVAHYTKSVVRGTDFGTQYEKNGNLFFRTDFNDTVFQVIPPNRLVPKYVLNLGKYKTSMLEGMDPGINLEGKIIPMDWAETENYIFLTFSKDSYDCLNSRKDKSLKIYHALYSKQQGKLSIIKGDPTDYSPNILKNDIDGGLPVWPKNYMTGKNDEILIPLRGNELKSYVLTARFKNSSAPSAKRNKLIEFANSVNKEDDILMIVE